MGKTTTPRAAAVDALSERAYERAGDEYTRAAWQRLATPHDGQHPFEADEHGWIGRGLQFMTAAAVAYRVASLPKRATHRAVEGVAVARDLQRTLDRPVQQACLGEFVADFRVVGDVGDARGAYEDAADAFREAAGSVEDPQQWATTPLFEAATATLKQVARGLDNGEIAIEWGDVHGSDPNEPGAFLARRVEYKRQRFRSLLARAIEAGHLAANRGTTEYSNDTFQCPNCGSTDVNWIVDRTLCLRCSSQMTPQ